ncbi:MAG: HAD-IA family hydrolase [Proteobacteria bacterium]|jgi:phosphoglycolate phosphatase|nr:HAD-IA family hydrolase [Pseudomonadota bacterium]MDA1034690.1 HAD-IA family hydrolase [Pseudomonadota bacterium]
MTKLLIFDWDGTVVDSTSHIVSSIKKTSKEVLGHNYNDIEIKKIIGLSLPQAFEKLTGINCMQTFQKFSEFYKNEYILNRPEPFEGILFGLERLQNNGFQLAVATGKSRKGLINDFQAFDLNHFFRDSRTADECFSKPHPQMIDQLVISCMALKENVLMIGDSLLDQNMAQNASVGFIGVTYGATSKNDFSNYLRYCADSPLDLFEWLIKNA